jgi:hypothetical protein
MKVCSAMLTLTKVAAYPLVAVVSFWVSGMEFERWGFASMFGSAALVVAFVLIGERTALGPVELLVHAYFIGFVVTGVVLWLSARMFK